jgi:hypothetical protein
MLVKLFDVQNGKVIPSEHCYSLKSLKVIMDKYPKTYLSVYLYIFYMTCPDPDMNPFFNVPEHEKEDLIIEEVELEESSEDSAIRQAVDMCKEMYQTPTFRAYKGIKTMLSQVRGGQGLAYDQL